MWTVGVVIGVGVLVAVVSLVAWKWASNREKAGRTPIVSLVYLLKKPRAITEEEVRGMVERVFGIKFESGNAQATEFVVMMPEPWGGNGFTIKVPHGFFLMHNVEMPYFKDPEKFAKQFVDRRLARAVGEHRAWLSVDAMGEMKDGEAKAGAYRAIGKMMAELGGEDCLAVFCPGLERCNQYDTMILTALRSEDPLALFEGPTFAPVVSVGDGDPRMLAATKEARERWPECVKAFEARTDQETPFLVKGEFREGDKVEFMWVSVERIDGAGIHGVLENTPDTLTRAKLGDKVTVPMPMLNDWLCVIDGVATGGFTLKVLAEMVKEK